jgi:hypothetical protein
MHVRRHDEADRGSHRLLTPARALLCAKRERIGFEPVSAQTQPVCGRSGSQTGSLCRFAIHTKVEGRNVAVEYKWAEDRTDRLPGLVEFKAKVADDGAYWTPGRRHGAPRRDIGNPCPSCISTAAQLKRKLSLQRSFGRRCANYRLNCGGI